MRFVIQVVSQAQVTVDEEVVGKIGPGMMVLVGVSGEDTEAVADRMIKWYLLTRR